MGLFDKLLDRGAKALGDAVSDKLSDVVNGDNEIGETFRSVKSAVSSATALNGITRFFVSSDGKQISDLML